MGKNSTNSRLFPAILGSGILTQRNRRIIDEDVYLSIIANEGVCKCRNRRKLSEVDECELSIFKPGGLYGLPGSVSDGKDTGPIGGSLTLNGRLTLLLAATAENQPLRVHRGKVLCGLEA